MPGDAEEARNAYHVRIPVLICAPYKGPELGGEPSYIDLEVHAATQAEASNIVWTSLQSLVTLEEGRRAVERMELTVLAVRAIGSDGVGSGFTVYRVTARVPLYKSMDCGDAAVFDDAGRWAVQEVERNGLNPEMVVLSLAGGSMGAVPARGMKFRVGRSQ